MSKPVIVQGTAVAAPAVPVASPTSNEASYGGGGATQISQEPSNKKTGCNDPIFALLFYGNIAAIVVVFIMYGKQAMSGDAADEYLTYVYAALIFSVASFLASGVGLVMLMACPAFMIKAGLIFSIIVMIAAVAVGFYLGNYIYGILASVFLLLTICYVKVVWRRVPFAAINMVTSGTAIKANLGVVFCAIFFTLIEVGWIVLWAVAFAGVMCDNNNLSCQITEQMDYFYLFLLFLSLFFTQQVLQACVHVTVAGVVGTWWVAPNESGCCSRGVCNSFIRTVTTSFGSICFGSLLVAIIQALQAVARAARQNDDCAILACICECILSCLASILDYFNKWAFIYVGIYGFSYIESAKSVMQLFADRGWEAIIADDLVSSAIFLVCIMIGTIAGGVGVGWARISPDFSDLADNSLWIAFLIGFVAGLCISLILLSLISSGVNTVIVMFADAPQEFERNHPELSAKMRATWQEFYPNSIQ